MSTRKPTIGVYVVRCVKNGFIYVGSSKRNVENRFSHHRAVLNKRTHSNVGLQRDWNKYGSKHFMFEVVVVCSAGKVRAVEQEWLDKHFNRKCYNRHPNSDSPLGAKFDPANHEYRSNKAVERCTLEWRSKVSKRVKLQHKKGKLGQATWTRPPNIPKGMDHPFYGKKGSLHPKFGKKASPEQKERYRLAAIKREQLKRERRHK